MLPRAQDGKIAFYLPIVVNEEQQTIESSFDELQQLAISSGFMKKEQAKKLSCVLQILITVASVNLGIGLIALLPIFKLNDGAEMIKCSESNVVGQVSGALIKALCWIGILVVGGSAAIKALRGLRISIKVE